MNGNQPTPTEPPGKPHRAMVVTLVFTEIVGSTALDSSACCSGEVRAWAQVAVKGVNRLSF